MKCPDCDGSAHGKHKAHWFKPTAAVVTHMPAKVANTSLVANTAKVANKHGQYADKDRRRAYMRDYMRAHRP